MENLKEYNLMLPSSNNEDHEHIRSMNILVLGRLTSVNNTYYRIMVTDEDVSALTLRFGKNAVWKR